jgi:hypothetical protein
MSGISRAMSFILNQKITGMTRVDSEKSNFGQARESHKYVRVLVLAVVTLANSTGALSSSPLCLLLPVYSSPSFSFSRCLHTLETLFPKPKSVNLGGMDFTCSLSYPRRILTNGKFSPAPSTSGDGSRGLLPTATRSAPLLQKASLVLIVGNDG